MAAITETLKLPSFRYPTKDPDTYLDFVAANTDYVDCGAHFNFSPQDGQFTISAWIYVNAAATDFFSTIVGTIRTSISVGDAQFAFNATTNKLYYFVQHGEGGGGQTQADSSVVLPRDRWHHVVLIVDNLNDQITFVINGVAETVSYSFVEGTGYISTYTTVNIGRRDNNGTLRFFDGRISNVRIYQDYLLPVEEAQAQYIRGVNNYGNADDTGLTGSYHLNEGTGIVALDAYEPTQSHGTILGSGIQEDRWVNAAPRSFRETILHDAPKAYWRMGDTKLPNVFDETGNFVGMQHFNAPAISQIGPFPGSKSVGYTRLSSHWSQIDENILGNTSFANAYSGEAWVKIIEDPVSSVAVIMSAVNVADDESNFGISVRVTTPANGLQHNEFPPAASELDTAANALIPDVWHHVVWTKDIGTNEREIFIDGVLNISDNSPEQDGTMDTMTRMYIGSGTGGTFFEGSLSEMVVYDYKLSAQQIADHYQAVQDVLFTFVENWEVYPIATFTVADNNPYAYLDQAEPLSTDIINDGVLGKSMSLVAVTGDDRGVFYSTVGQFVDGRIEANVVTPTGGTTFSAPSVFMRGTDNDNAIQIRVDVKDNRLRVVERWLGGNSTLLDYSIALSSNTKYTVECIISGNGTIVITNLYDDETHNNLLRTSGPVSLVNTGIAGWAGIMAIGTSGSIQRFNNVQVRRGCAQSYSNAVLASIPIGYYRLNETSGTDVVDSSGNDKTGTWNGTTNLGASGLVTGGDLAAIWDGSTAYVEIPGANYNIITEDFAIEMWIKTSQNTGNVIIWDKRDSGNDSQGWMVGIVSGKASLFIKDAPTANTIINGLIDVADNTFHHLVFNYDRSGLGEVWVDGILDNSGSITGHPSIGALTTASRIGAKTTTSSYVNFNGTMDEVAFYKSKLLTAAEITAHYVRGVRCDGSLFDSKIYEDLPKFWAKLDETSGTAAEDLGSANLTGTYVGAPTLAQTPLINFGSSVLFNGSSQYVNYPTNSSGEFQDAQFTVEAWITPTTLAATPVFFHTGILVSSTASGIYLYITSLGALSIGMYTGGAWRNFPTADGTIVAGTKYHIALKLNENNWIRWYVNGVFVKEISFPYLSPPTSTNSIRLANQQKSAGDSNYFTGNMDEVVWFDSLLDDARIALHYSEGLK